MSDLAQRELELTPELLDYAQRVAMREARKVCPKDACDDVVQGALFNLIRWPPRFDPARGTTERTFLHSCVLVAVRKAARTMSRQSESFRQSPGQTPNAAGDETPANEPVAFKSWQAQRLANEEALEDLLAYVVDEQSRALARTLVECDGNVSETARRLGISEGTVRYRIGLLRPRLRLAGFDPFRQEDL